MSQIKSLTKFWSWNNELATIPESNDVRGDQVVNIKPIELIYPPPQYCVRLNTVIPRAKVNCSYIDNHRVLCGSVQQTHLHDSISILPHFGHPNEIGFGILTQYICIGINVCMVSFLIYNNRITLRFSNVRFKIVLIWANFFQQPSLLRDSSHHQTSHDPDIYE